MTGRGERGRAERERITWEVLLRDPEQWHTIRSLIFSGDDAERAPVGLLAVDRLVDIAPDSHGSYHMPSHTYIDFGMWDEASRTSERAFAMGRDWMRTRGFDITEIDQVDDHTYGNHLFGYLQYPLLQKGRYADAKALVEQARTDYEDSGRATSARVSLASTSARYLVETGHWDEASTLAETARTGGFADTPDVLLAVGLGAAQTGDLELAREAEAGLIAAGSAAALMSQEVTALIHLAEGDEETAIRLLEEAAQTTARRRSPSACRSVETGTRAVWRSATEARPAPRGARTVRGSAFAQAAPRGFAPGGGTGECADGRRGNGYQALRRTRGHVGRCRFGSHRASRGATIPDPLK